VILWVSKESLGSCGVIYQLRKDGFMYEKYRLKGGGESRISEEDWGLFSIGEFTGAEMTGP